MFTFPFRWPSLREALGLFLKPTRVDDAVAGIQMAITRAEAVLGHAEATATQIKLSIQAMADKIDTAEERHRLVEQERIRAQRVIAKLRDLVS